MCLTKSGKKKRKQLDFFGNIQHQFIFSINCRVKHTMLTVFPQVMQIFCVKYQSLCVWWESCTCWFSAKKNGNFWDQPLSQPYLSAAIKRRPAQNIWLNDEFTHTQRIVKHSGLLLRAVDHASKRAAGSQSGQGGRRETGEIGNGRNYCLLYTSDAADE